jgi:peroxiredoxin
MGGPVVINFWRTDWTECREEFPYLQEIYQTESPPLVLLTINQGESLAEVTDFIEDNNYSFPVLLDTDYAVSLYYGIFGIPITYFIDKDGVIQQRKFGGYQSTAEIEAHLELIMP